MALNPADLAFASWLAEDELARQRAVQKARDYHDGLQLVWLTDRLREFLGYQVTTRADDFRLNVCRPVVNALTERLLVSSVGPTEESKSKASPLSDWSSQVWQANRMDAAQHEIHTAAVRDGEAFIIVDWDPEEARPRFTVHPRYVDGTAGGDGFGCRMHYPDADPSRPPDYASKRWTERTERGAARQRLTLYYPDRVEKYVHNGLRFDPVQDPGDPGWPIPWLAADGLPIGLAVAHFKNRDLRPEAWDAVPLQNAINKALVDIVAAADVTAFRFFVAMGWVPTSDGKAPASDGSNQVNLQPGSIIGTTRPASEVSFQAIEGANLAPLIDLINSLIVWLAMVTDTPVTRFQSTRQVAAEGTLKQQNEPLLAKVKLRQTLLGNAWEDAYKVARRLANTYGAAGLDEEPAFNCQWSDPSPRDELDLLQALAIKRDKLAVPVEQLWREAGYDEDEIAAMKNSEEYKARLGMMKLGLAGQQEIADRGKGGPADDRGQSGPGQGKNGKRPPNPEEGE